MSSTTPLLTQRKIDNKENEIRLKTLLLAKLPRKTSPTRHRLEKDIERLKTEVSALRASLHYYKPVERLALDIEAQRHHVRSLIEKTKQAKRKDRPKAVKALKAHNLHLKEMLVAAKLKSINPNMTPGVSVDLPSAPTLVLPTAANLPENASIPASFQVQIDEALAAEAAPPPLAVTPAQALAVELQDYAYLRPGADLSLGDAEYAAFEQEAEYAGLLGDEEMDYKSILIGAAIGLGVGWYFFKGPSA